MPDASRQLVEVPKREQLTEAEARLIGASAQRLARFRYLLTMSDKGGSINATPGGGAMHGENISGFDLKAALRTLIDREEAFLSSFNVQIERSE